MSTTIDQRVVEMKFDNKHFESNVSTTMSTLDKLKKSLNLTGAAKGLEDVSTAAKNCDVSVVGTAAEKVGLKFSAMYTMADQALRNITNSAMAAGKKIVSALTIDPIKTGFSEYETQINAIQTILANTESKGTTLDDVNSALDELNAYADKTIYNFTEMTRNIGTFTAAGTDLDTSVKAIQGIANLAAVSGSTSQQASTAMYQLSQAMASGTVKLMDWNSVVNAGMGGQVFQDALKETAKVHGVAIDEIIEKNGSFRESLSEGWLTTDILTDTLEKFTMYAEEGSKEWEAYKKTLMEKGYTEKQAEEILKMGKTATEAATKVKTFTQLYDTLKEAAQSGWTQTWEILIGDFEEAKELLTKISDVVGGFIGKSAEARNELLENWKVMGGRDDLIKSFSNIWDAILSVITPIKEAFREIFPPATAEQLFKITEKFKEFTEKLILGEKGAENLKRTFKGIFSVFKLVTTVIGAVFKAVGKLFSGVGALGGGFLSVTAIIGDFLSIVVETITYGNIFENVFSGIAKVFNIVIKVVAELIKGVASLIDHITGNLIFPGFVGLVELFKSIFNWITDIGDSATSMKDRVVNAFGSIGDALKNNPLVKFFTSVWSGIKKIASSIGQMVGNIFGELLDKLANADIMGIIEIINGIITGGIGVSLIKFFSNLGGSVKSFKDLLGGFDDILGTISGSLKAFQNSLNAEAIKNLAIAIAILAGAVLVLSLINSDKLTDAVAAITMLFAGLMGNMAVLSKMSGITNVAAISGAMISLSIGVLILSSALKKISSLNVEDISRGLIGISGLMLALALSMRVLSTGQNNVVKGSIQMIGLAIAVKMLANTLADIAKLSWEEMRVGAVGILAVMATLVGAMKVLAVGGSYGKPATKVIAQMGTVVAAVKVLAGVLVDIAYLDWEELKIGIIGMTATMAVLVGAMKVLGTINDYSKTTNDVTMRSSHDMIGIAAAVMALALAVRVLTPAIETLGRMEWTELGKAGAVFGGLIVALGLFSLETKLVNSETIVKTAFSLLTISAALIVLAGAFKIYSGMEWEELGKAGSVLAAIVATLALMALESKLVKPGTINAMSASMTILAAALILLVPPLAAFGAMNWSSLAKAGSVLGGLVGVLALMGLISKIINPGALAVMAASVAILASSLGLMVLPLMSFGLIKWSSIGKGLAILAGSLTILGVAAVILKKLHVDVIIFKISAALALMGVGMHLIGSGLVLAGAGVAAFGAGLAVLATSIAAVVIAIVKLLPSLIEAFAEGVALAIIAVCKVIADGASAIGGALKSVIVAACDVLIDCVPILVNTLLVIIDDLLRKLVDYVPSITDSLFKILVAVLGSLAKFIPSLVDMLVDIVLLIVDGVADRAPELVESFVNLFAVIFKALGDALSGFDTGDLLKGVVAVGLLALLVDKLAKVSIKSIPKAMLGLVGIGALMVELTAILALIGALTKDPEIKQLVSSGGDLLGEVSVAILKAVPLFGALAILLATCSLITPLIPTAGLAMAGIGVLIVELTAILSLLGGLYRVQGVKDLISDGGELLVTISEIIGRVIGAFAGGLVGGVVEGVFSSLPNIAKDLSGFIENIQPFVDGVKSIDSSVLTGVGYLTGAILAMAGTSIVTALANVLTLGTGGMSFAAAAWELGWAISQFSDAVTKKGGIDIASVKSAADAAGPLVKAIAAMTGTSILTAITTVLSAGLANATFAAGVWEIGWAIKSFSDAVTENGGIDTAAVTTAVNAAGPLVKAVLAMTGTSFLTALSGVVGFVSFGLAVETVALAVKKFSDKVSENGGINTDAVSTAANAAGPLVKAVLAMTGTSFLTALSGIVGLKSFELAVETVGSTIKTFSDKVSADGGINTEAVNTAANASYPLVKAVLAMTGTSFLTALSGVVGFVSFGLAVETVALAVKKFSDKVSENGGINTDAVSTAANAAGPLVKAVLAMTGTSIITGIATLLSSGFAFPAFIGAVATLGESISTFSQKVSGEGINLSSVEAAAAAAGPLTEAVSHMTKGGFLSALGKFISSGMQGSNFKNAVTSIGEAIKTFSDTINKGKGINPEQVSSAATAAKDLGDMCNNLPENSDKVVSFGDNLKLFGTKMAEYFNNTKNITKDSISASSNAITAIKDITSVDTGKISSVANSINNVGNSIKNLANVPSNVLSSFTSGLEELESAGIKAIENLGKNITKKFKDAFKSLNKDLKKEGRDAIDGFVTGVNDKKSKAEKVFKKLIEACSDAIRNKKNSFKSAGKDLVQGFADGIKANTFKAEARAKAMAEAALEAARKVLRINSPSKAFREMGYSIPEGLAMGIDKFSGMAADSATSMANDSINSVRSSISRIADAINSDIDAQPTIRPVLDLSDVESGADSISRMFDSRNSVGVLANVGAISSTMSKRNQNGANDDVVSAIKDLAKDMGNNRGDTYNFGNISYDDDSSIAAAVRELARAAKLGRRV